MILVHVFAFLGALFLALILIGIATAALAATMNPWSALLLLLGFLFYLNHKKGTK